LVLIKQKIIPYIKYMVCEYKFFYSLYWIGMKLIIMRKCAYIFLAHLIQRTMWDIIFTLCPSSSSWFVNSYILIFFSESTVPIGTKCCRNVHWFVLYEVYCFYAPHTIVWRHIVFRFYLLVNSSVPLHIVNANSLRSLVQ